jgi:hypothetical protein
MTSDDLEFWTIVVAGILIVTVVFEIGFMILRWQERRDRQRSLDRWHHNNRP